VLGSSGVFFTPPPFSPFDPLGQCQLGERTRQDSLSLLGRLSAPLFCSRLLGFSPTRLARQLHGSRGGGPRTLFFSLVFRPPSLPMPNFDCNASSPFPDPFPVYSPVAWAGFHKAMPFFSLLAKLVSPSQVQLISFLFPFVEKWGLRFFPADVLGASHRTLFLSKVGSKQFRLTCALPSPSSSVTPRPLSFFLAACSLSVFRP